MHHARALASRRRMGVAAAFSLLASAAVTPNVAMLEALEVLEECEAPLGHLITILESKRQLAGTKERYRGAALNSDYSKCRIRQQGRLWPQYAVFRSSDDVTVVIEKRLSEREEPVLYGPFRSAYRK